MEFATYNSAMDDLGSSSPLSAVDGDDSSTTAPQHRLLELQPGAAANGVSSSFHKTDTVGGQNASAGVGNDASAIVKKPRPRKKKEDSSITAQDGETKPQKKTRKPRDPNAPPAKRQKKSSEPATTDPQQKKLGFGMSNAASPAVNLLAQGTDSKPSPAPSLGQPSNMDADQKPVLSAAQYGSVATQPRPQSSGQRYDPIRHASAENARLAKSPQHARASPSISSLIDPPNTNNTPNHPSTSASKVPEVDLTKPPSPTKPPSSGSTQQAVGTSSISGFSALHPDTALGDAAQAKALMNGKSTTASRGSSPKPARKKKEIPQLPPGNGLLSGSDFGKQSGSNDSVFSEVPNQCIVIDVPITGETNNYVNFMKEVEAKYGFDVAHPRLAEHRRRMAQMAAAGAALESGTGSADDMAIDGSDIDSNVEMGGVDEESSPGEGVVKKKRKARGDEYDKNDDFIDDTEQAWEEQALASRDGYFVWSGPLVPEGDKPTVERADGTVKRGRGSRGGRGGARGDGTGRSRGTGTRRGGGRGSRSSGAAPTRKSRITKAEKEEMEQEKAARQKLAASLAKPVMTQGIIGM